MNTNIQPKKRNSLGRSILVTVAMLGAVLGVAGTAQAAPHTHSVGSCTLNHSTGFSYITYRYFSSAYGTDPDCQAVAVATTAGSCHPSVLGGNWGLGWEWSIV